MDNKTFVWITETKEKDDNILLNNFENIFFSLQRVEHIPVKIPNQIITSKNIVLVFTSKHATKILSDYNFDKNVLVGCVGKSTAQEIIAQGFKNVFYPKTHGALNLYEEILKKIPKDFLVIYFSGNRIRFNISKALQEKGFKAKRFVVYKTIDVNFLSKKIVDGIQKKSISHVSFSSIGAFFNFERLIKKDNLDCHYMTAVCISDDVAKVCKKYFERVLVN